MDMKVVAIFVCLVQCLLGQRLGEYNVDSNAISVSGISAGGAMAQQMHVAFSSSIMGMASFAGIPYFCAEGQIMNTLLCMNTPEYIKVADLISETKRAEGAGQINQVSNMKNDRVFLFHGSKDGTVAPAASKKSKEYYTKYGANILTEFTLPAGHGMPTSNYGIPCGDSGDAYINNCKYDGAGVALQHIYGNLNPKGNGASGTFQEFDQGEFVNSVGRSFAKRGFMYVPSSCASKVTPCRLHFAFHGCLQSRSDVQARYARNAGYNEWAETNNIIVVYPQAQPNMLVGNPNGCWDWWGYDDPSVFDPSVYHLTSGPQMVAVKAMIDRIASGSSGLTTMPGQTLPPTKPPIVTSKRCKCTFHMEPRTNSSDSLEHLYTFPDILYNNTVGGCDQCTEVLRECPHDCLSNAREFWGNEGLRRVIVIDGNRRVALGQVICQSLFRLIGPPGRTIGVHFNPNECGRLTPVTVFVDQKLCCDLLSDPIIGEIAVWNPDCSDESK
ncbi:unnamed protein product [Owenia fusiformis]|uniref:Peptidase S9 prolyl oligopeptidase catalytic domain-containing protein n=1 Tax=Owenia fusiformis TaxID=6347 RepID=A0A8J1XSF0_OWEFU|nr:unnamed protein product [Owenia fusiformis]